VPAIDIDAARGETLELLGLLCSSPSVRYGEAL
jgi:hypothetical protein